MEQKENGQKDTRILESMNVMSDEVIRIKEKCEYFRKLLDEGTYKIDSVLNIVETLKNREQNIIQAGGDQAVLQQMNEEQINSFLEMLKTPAFQNIARQLLIKWGNQSKAQGSV